MQGEVLIVDDTPLLPRSLARSISRLGLSVTSTEDPVEALALLDTRIFDVVIADVIMPVVGGLSLLQRAHARDPDTAVILITGVADEASAGVAVGLRAFRWMRKPIEQGILCDVVAQGVEQATSARLARRGRPVVEATTSRRDDSVEVVFSDGAVKQFHVGKGVRRMLIKRLIVAILSGSLAFTAGRIWRAVKARYHHGMERKP